MTFRAVTGQYERETEGTKNFVTHSSKPEGGYGDNEGTPTGLYEYDR